MEQKVESNTAVLVQEAQKAKDAAIGHLEKLRHLTALALHHVEEMAPQGNKPGVPVKLDEFGQPLPFNAKDFSSAVKTTQQTARDLLKFADEVTGVDVVKQIAVRTNSDKDGKLLTWDGIDALTGAIEADIVQDVAAVETLALLPPEKPDPWS